MDVGANGRVFRFGVFEVDASTGELRKQGRKVSLQGQPFEILLMLLEHPGELVERTEIRQRLWPETFVDFDHSLNTAINKIRDVLGDSAGSPRFVETLARRGYRFIAPVRVETGNDNPIHVADNTIESGTQVSAVAGNRNSSAASESKWSTRDLLTSEAELPEAPHRVVRLLFFLLQLMYFCFYVISLARLHVIEESVGGAVVRPLWLIAILVVSAVVGIPTRLYLMSAVAFNAPGVREKFLRLFVVIFPLDGLWALAPFLLLPWIGYGLALACTAILLYVPFAERSLVLMGAARTAVQRVP